MEKVREIHLKAKQEENPIRLVKNFFDSSESWGRQNRNQFIMGLECTIGYLLVNILFIKNVLSWNPFSNTSNGLIAAMFICIGIIVINFFDRPHVKYPWYEKYMPKIITLLGVITLIAFQNLDGKGVDDIGLWIDIIFLLVIFIVAAGYFVEESSNEKVIKIWFALLGYYFSVITFFYLLERWFY